MRKISSWWKKISKIPKSGVWRTVWLIAAVAVGIPSAWEIVEMYKGLAMDYIPRITDYIALISIPILFVLWLFRTYDVREQIEKTQENINSGLYSKGVELLASEDKISRRNGLLIMSIVRRRGLLKEEIDIITSSGLNLEQAYLMIANLKEMNLLLINLRGANLLSANLNRTFLAHADLRDANLIAANLENANLRKANLKNANLLSARLANVDLVRANLASADLGAADLTTAKLKGAIYNNETIFPDGFDPEQHGMIKKE